MDASSDPAGTVESETIDSSIGGAVDACAASVGWVERRDEQFVSRGCEGGHLLCHCREGREINERFVSRGRGGRHLGPGKEG